MKSEAKKVVSKVEPFVGLLERIEHNADDFDI